MPKEDLKRCDVKEEYKWDTSFLYKSEEDFYKDLECLKKYILDIKKYKGKICKDENILYEFLSLDLKTNELISDLYTYASCLLDTDLSDKKSQKLYSDILNVYGIYSVETSFIVPELMKVPYNKIEEYIKKNEKLKQFSKDLKDIYKYQKHTLSESEEKLLANISELQNKYEENFSVTLNSIMDLSDIKDADGNLVKLNMNNYSKYIKSNNRDVRKAAFESRGEALKKYAPTLAIDYEGLVKADTMIAKTRNYSSTINMHLYADDVNVTLYDNLIKIAKDNINTLHKFFKMKKDILGYDKIYSYDLSAPLTKDANKKYSIEEAKDIILNALSPLGSQYINILKKAFEEKWIDFMPNKNKRIGYYETVASKGHPLVLANYNEDFYDVSGICHELGHAIHSYYSMKNQPSNLSSYSIFVAEVISLTNELILSNYIVNNSKDKKEKLIAIENILNVFSDNLFGTLTEGSIFERKVHERIENEEALSETDFNQIFDEIINNYYGDVVEKDCYSKYNWSRVPHFYTPFYYYKYAIGISCACFVAKNILEGNKSYLDKYYEFIKLGSSLSPLEELKVLDIDLLDDNVIKEAIKYFDNLIDEYIEIYNEK